MSPSLPLRQSPGSQGPSFGADFNTEGGGVWQNTSAKKEKIIELKGELPHLYKDPKREGKGWVRQVGLDDATDVESERWDNDLADGMGVVWREVDRGLGVRVEVKEGKVKRGGVREWEDTIEGIMKEVNRQVEEVERAMVSVNRSIVIKESEGSAEGLEGVKEIGGFWARRISDFIKIERDDDAAEKDKNKVKNEVTDPDEYDVMDDKDIRFVDFPDTTQTLSDLCSGDYKRENTSELHSRLFSLLVVRHKLEVGSQLLRALEGKEGFDKVTRVVDADVDRAAMDGGGVSKDREVELGRVHMAVDCVMNGEAEVKLRAIWELHHKDDVGGENGGIEREEMESVVEVYSSAVLGAARAIGGRTIDGITEVKGRDWKVVGTKKHKKR